MSLGLITSAAYANSEMAAEFGILPPSFLPAGNTRLFRHQAQLLSKIADRVVLTLPESFTVPVPDARLDLSSAAYRQAVRDTKPFRWTGASMAASASRAWRKMRPVTARRSCPRSWAVRRYCSVHARAIGSGQALRSVYWSSRYYSQQMLWHRGCRLSLPASEILMTASSIGETTWDMSARLPTGWGREPL